MTAILRWLFKFPDGCLLSIGVPVVLAFLLPTKEHRFMLPLVWGPTKNQRLLFPDTGAGEVESSLAGGSLGQYL